VFTNGLLGSIIFLACRVRHKIYHFLVLLYRLGFYCVRKNKRFVQRIRILFIYNTVEAAYALGLWPDPVQRQYFALQHHCTLCTDPVYKPLCTYAVINQCCPNRCLADCSSTISCSPPYLPKKDCMWKSVRILSAKAGSKISNLTVANR
jgi:hypothetical protein